MQQWVLPEARGGGHGGVLSRAWELKKFLIALVRLYVEPVSARGRDDLDANAELKDAGETRMDAVGM